MTPRQINAADLATTRSVNRWIEQFNKENGTKIPKGIDLKIDDVALLDWIQKKIRKSKGDQAAIQFERLRDPNNPFPELSLNDPEEDPHANDVEGIVSKTVVSLPDGKIAIVDDEPREKTGIESPEWKERAQKFVDEVQALPDEVKDLPQKEEETPWTFRRILSVLPLPMLGLAASYGVYHFAANFAPDWVAIAEASAFELTYIGLAALEGLSKEQKERASFVARGAVAVSIIYNSIAGALYLDPQLFEDLGRFAFWSVSILHGVPLAVLAYLVADLVLHSETE